MAVEKQNLKSWWADLPAPSQVGHILLCVTAALLILVTIISGVSPKTNVIYLIVISVVSVLTQIGASLAFSETQKVEEAAKRKLLEQRQVNERHARSVDRNLRSTLKNVSQALDRAETAISDRDSKDSRDLIQVIGTLSVDLSYLTDHLVNVIEDWNEYFPEHSNHNFPNEKE